MRVVFDEEGLREDFEAESIPSLVEYWGETMHDDERAILYEVLAARRYRVRSLPSVPSYETKALAEEQALMAKNEPSDKEDVAARIRSGIGGVIVLGISCFIYGNSFNPKDDTGLFAEGFGKIGDFTIKTPTLFFALSICFLLLFVWSRFSALPAFSIATLLWLAALGLLILQSSGPSIYPLILSGLPLCIGLIGAYQTHKEEQLRASEYYS
jgi:hypothetical protein